MTHIDSGKYLQLRQALLALEEAKAFRKGHWQKMEVRLLLAHALGLAATLCDWNRPEQRAGLIRPSRPNRSASHFEKIN